jgi:zinc protease
MLTTHHRRGRAFYVLALAAMLPTLLLTGCLNRSDQPPKVKLAFEKYKLQNGLEVILHRDTRLPLVGVNLWYHVGPAKETQAGPVLRISSST